ncbi:MAG: sodium/proton-translocating pyrophosphatase, partial [Polyangiaceae bacterium]
MTELIVVLGLCLCSLSLAAVLGRWLAAQRTGAYEVQRLLGAVTRAGGDFLKQEGRLLGVSLVLVALAVLTPVVLYRSAAAVPEHVGWTALGLCLGAGAGSLVARAAFAAAVTLTSRVVEAMRSDLNDATSAALRGSALIALLTDAVSLLLTLLVLAIPAWYLRESPDAVSPWSFAAVRLLPAAALGAVAAAAVFQLGGANFHTAAGVASLAARREDPSLRTERDKNPALVAELVGDYVGAVAARASDYFAALVLGNSAMLLVAVWVHRNNPGTSGWALVTLPLLVRAVGLIASSLALGNLRFDGTQSTWRTLAGAAASAALVSVVGLFGASLWLVGGQAHLHYFAAGALGLLANSLALGLTYLRLRRDVRRRGEAGSNLGSNLGSNVGGDTGSSNGDRAEAPELDVGSPAARALGQGLQQTWSLMVGVGLCVLGAWLLGTSAALREGGPLALALMLAGLLSLSAFGLTESLFARVAESVRTIAALERSQIDARGRARALEIDRLGVPL